MRDDDDEIEKISASKFEVHGTAIRYRYEIDCFVMLYQVEDEEVDRRGKRWRDGSEISWSRPRPLRGSVVGNRKSSSC